MDRREFFHAAGAVGALATARVHGASQNKTVPARGDRDAWSAPPQPWTAVKAWSGQPFPIDHAL